jgi:hypothetical protein
LGEKVVSRIKYNRVLIFLFLFGFQQSYAGVEERIAELEKHLEAKKQEFPEFVLEAYRNQVLEHYAMMFEDYYKAVFYTEAQLQESSSSFQAVNNQLNVVFKELQPGTGSFYHNWFLISSMDGYFERMIDQVNKNVSDLNKFKSLWKDRCSSSKLKMLDSKLKPSLNFSFVPLSLESGSVYQLDFHIQTPSSSYFESHNFGADGFVGQQPTRTYLGGPIGSTAEAFFRDAMNRSTSGFDASQVASEVGFLASVGIGLVNTSEDNRKNQLLQKQFELMKEIQVEHDKVLKNADQASYQSVQDLCLSVLDERLIKIIEFNSSFALKELRIIEEAKKIYHEQKDLVKKEYDTHLERLEREYFPVLKGDYLSSIHKKFEELHENDNDALSFFIDDIGPVISHHSKNLSENYLSKLSSKQEIWTLMILGESRFHPYSSYQFGKDNYNSLVYESNWGHFTKELVNTIIGD